MEMPKFRSVNFSFSDVIIIYLLGFVFAIFYHVSLSTVAGL